MAGRKHTPEAIEKIRQSKIGITFSRTEEDKLSRKVNSVRNIPVDMFTVDGAFVKSFASRTQAAEHLGIHPSLVTRVLNGKLNTIKNHIFKVN